MKKTKKIDFEMKMKFKTDIISNASLFHIKNTTAVVTHLYNAIQRFSIEDIKPLPTDSYPMIFDDGNTALVYSNQNELTLNWLMKKAFEDFINAIFKSLKEAFKFVKFLDYCSKGEYQGYLEKTLEELKDIEFKSEKDPFPRLIEKIEKVIDRELELKEEITSMNKGRNCLVHRDGNVKKMDTNNIEKDLLVVKWKSFNIYVKTNEDFERLTFKKREKPILVKAEKSEELIESKKFKIGDDINFNINDFNGMSYCCYKFATNLYQSCMEYQDRMIPLINNESYK